MRHQLTAWTCLILTLALSALASSPYIGRAQAATIVVTTTADENDACDAQGCSLREAITAAAPGDEITFSPLFNSPQTVTLQFGELLIEKNLTIEGPGASLLTVSGNNQSRVLRVRSGFTVNISGLTVADGNGVSNTNPGLGGAILTQGTLTLTQCRLKDNRGDRGGAIFNGAGGNLTLIESQVSNSTATDRGGGISSNAVLNVLRSTILGNTAQGPATGGGIDASGTLNVINSTISNNRTTNSNGPNGGGIIVFGANSRATIVNATVTQNFVASNSHTGGIHRNGGTVTLRNTIVAGNQPPPLPAQANASKSGVGAASASVAQPGEDAPDVGGQLVSAEGGGNNLIGDVGTATGLTGGVGGDRIGGGDDPKLDAGLDTSPKNNGGPTDTHALLSGSPAINAGNDCVVTNTCNPPLSEALTTDQTGSSRNIGGEVDMGAVEFGRSCSFVVEPLSFNVSAAEQNITVNVKTQPGCTWTGKSKAAFIDGEGGGNGDGSISFSVQANLLATRPGEVEVANQTVKVNQKGRPVVSIEDQTQPESSTGFRFVVSLSEPASEFVSVNAIVRDGTATRGGDYELTSTTTLRFPPGQTRQTFDAPIVNDDFTEPDEDFFVQLTEPNGVLIGDGESHAIIRDNDPAVLNITDGEEAIDGIASVVFAVRLASPNPLTVTVQFATADGTAKAGEHYAPESGTLTFEPFQIQKVILVNLATSRANAANKTFFVNLSNATNATIGDSQGVGAFDGPDAPTLQFGNGTLNVSEGASSTSPLKSPASGLSGPLAAGANSLAVTVTRTGDLDVPVAVDYETLPDASFAGCDISDGAASERCDFTTTLGTLRFAPGEGSKTFNVFITDDAYLEGAETFTVALTNPTGTGVVLGDTNTLTVTIDDDDTGAAPNPIDDSPFFVLFNYIDFLNRGPDAPGLAFWANQITSCGMDAACVSGRRDNVSVAFFLAIEFEGTGYQVIRIYKTTFDDSPQRSRGLPRYREFVRDAQAVGRDVAVGVGDWEQRLAANLLDFAREWVQRPEVLAELPADMTAAQFVDQLFANAETTPTAGEHNDAIAAFGAGGVEGRAAALLAVTASGSVYNRQFNSALVLMEYFGYLRRNPSDTPDTDFAGYDFWLDKLDSFSLPGEDMRDAGTALSRIHRAEMVRAFISSTEYRSRFGLP